MKFVLITVLLQLFLSVLEVNAGIILSKVAAAGGVEIPAGEFTDENDLQFGDLLVTPRFLISHYAVYVGKEHINGKNSTGNIFEMMKNPDGCRFHTEQGPFRRHNYLDPGIAPQSKQQMKDTIESLMNNPVCQTYHLFTRNCEQIATKVRYNESHCMQLGTISRVVAQVLPAGSVHRREAPAAA